MRLWELLEVASEPIHLEVNQVYAACSFDENWKAVTDSCSDCNVREIYGSADGLTVYVDAE